MVAGRLPFQGENSHSMLYAIVHGEPIPLDGAGVQVDRIVSKTLAKDTAKRYQTAAELIDDLEPLKGVPNAATETLIRQPGRRGRRGACGPRCPAISI
jgi:hypothetical protein